MPPRTRQSKSREPYSLGMPETRTLRLAWMEPKSSVGLVCLVAISQSYEKVAQCLLRLGQEIPVIEEVVKAAGGFREPIIRLLLHKCGHEIRITEDLFETALR